jgi:signal transduction histidine kinase
LATVPASFDRWWNGISLRAKITGVTVLLLTFGLTVAGAGTMSVLRNYLIDTADAKVNSLYTSAGNLKLTDVAACGVQYEPNEILFSVLNSDGSTHCTNVPRTADTPNTGKMDLAWVSAIDGDASTILPKTTIADSDGSSHWRVVAFPLQLTSDGDYSVVVVGISIDDVDSTVARYILIFFGFALAVVVFGAATTQLLVTSTFAPLRDVEATAARFAAGDYSQRLGGATPNTEVGRLNRSLNTMLARIDRAFADRQRTVEQMRRFVGDASHELRTPLVSVRGYAELYRMGAIQSPEDVAQAMGRIEAEAIRMGGLVEDLLELARLDEAKPLRLAPVGLLPIAQDAALDATAGNPGRRIRVIVPASFEEPDASPVEPVGTDAATAGATALCDDDRCHPAHGRARPPAQAPTRTCRSGRRDIHRGPTPASRRRADRARRGRQDPPGGHEPDGQRDAVHPAGFADRARRRGRPRGRVRPAVDHRPRRGHPAAAAREDLPALLACGHLPHPSHRRQRTGPRDRGRHRREPRRTRRGRRNTGRRGDVPGQPSSLPQRARDDAVHECRTSRRGRRAPPLTWPA